MSRGRRDHLWLACLAIATASLLGGPARAASVPFEPLPPRPGWLVASPPNVSAPSWILFDVSSDWLIAGREYESRRPLASTTKMMTALVAADRSDFDEMVTVSATAAEAGEAEIGLVAGEVLRMGDLVSAILIRSANDAAEAIAEHIGGSIEGFAELMNQKAAEMGLANTHFVNPHGLDAPDHYSSARDLMQIAREVLANPQLAAMVRSTSIDFPPAPDGTRRGGTSTNALLEGYEGAIGVKTGFTFQASLVLAAAAERDGRLLMAVVMGSEGIGAHFADAAALLDYGFAEAAIHKTPGTSPAAARLDRVARVEALTWLAASGLLTDGGGSDPAPEVMSRGSQDPPGWREALSWAPRYWGWLSGGG
jgi:serine-type D-Ala-D-Ala carboxypeptidase (penicillin-binding protein 5/6)